MTKARTLADFDASTALTGNINLATQVTGLLPLANGGTGATSLPAGGITEHDIWRLTQDVTTQSETLVAAKLARTTVLSFEKIGTGMTVATDGAFSFPSTGKYVVEVRAGVNNGANKIRSANIQTQYTANNSSYAQVSSTAVNMYDDGTENTYAVGHNKFTFDITDIANQKVKFHLVSSDSATTFGGGTSATNANQCTFTFTKLGDT
tara:strand:- start:4875 stop:5495 length:621 start_codon:yes stop_codon:yes gene_type:complete